MELKDIAGVIGVYIYHPGSGVIIKNVPAVFKNTILTKIGRMLMKIYSAGNMGFSDLMEASLFYKEFIVVIREIKNKHYIVVLFDPDAKINTLIMGLNLVMDELMETVENIAMQAPARKDADHTVPLKMENSPLLPDDLLNAGPMAGSLQGMEKALIKVMGPIAKIIFADALTKWADQDEPDYSTMPNLVRILGKEIDDQEKFNVYQRRIGHYLWVNT